MDTPISPPRLTRSALFVPADRPRAIEKAAGLNADILILDLEDAVAPDQKTAARANVADAMAQFKASGACSVLRIHEPGSAQIANDMAVFADTTPDAVLIAKLQNMDHLRGARARLNGAGYTGPLWAMIECPRGIFGLETMVDQAHLLSLELVIVGTNDLAKALHIPDGPKKSFALKPHIARILLAGRAIGIPVLDGVYNAFKDEIGFKVDAETARDAGFDGKALIHPSQVNPANAIFTPSEAEIGWAKAVVAAYEDPENAAKGAISVDGQMVERLHLKTAHTVLAALEQINQAR